MKLSGRTVLIGALGGAILVAFIVFKLAIGKRMQSTPEDQAATLG